MRAGVRFSNEESVMARRWTFESVEALDRFMKQYMPKAKGKRVGETTRKRRKTVGESGVRKLATAQAGVFNPTAAAMQRVADAMPAPPKKLRKMTETEFRNHAGGILQATVIAEGHAVAQRYWDATTRGERAAIPLDEYIAGLNGHKAA
jgi:hypothetical protein